MEISQTYSAFVADSTPLMKIESYPQGYALYKALFDILYIPQAVARELQAGLGMSFEEYTNLYDITDFVQVIRTTVNQSIQGIDGLHRGEAEAISLAHAKQLPLLIEERKGRKIAHENNLKFLGNAGLVLYGYKQGLLSQSVARQHLDKLYAISSFKKSIYDIVLKSIEASS